MNISRNKNYITIAILISCILSFFLLRLITMNVDRNSGTMVIREDEQYGGGRYLMLNGLDSSFIAKECPDASHVPTPNARNVQCLVDSEHLDYCDSIDGEEFEFPVFVHRFSERVDTFYTLRHGSIGIGYIQRSYYGKEWLVLEAKEPSRVLGHSHLTKKEYRDIPIEGLGLQHYTYEGQRIFFDNDSTKFWIASRKTTDIYGPLTEAELRIQLKRLKIELPITLEGLYDRYVYNHTEQSKDGRFQKNKLPKDFSWPFWTERPDRIIKPFPNNFQ